MSLLGLAAEALREPRPASAEFRSKLNDLQPRKGLSFLSLDLDEEPASVRFDLRSRNSPLASSSANAYQEPRILDTSSSPVARGSLSAIDEARRPLLSVRSSLSPTIFSSHGSPKLRFGTSELEPEFSCGSSLESHARMRQRCWGTLRSSWLVKNSFSTWRSHVLLTLQAERARHERSQELSVIWELENLVALKTEEIQELLRRLERDRRSNLKIVTFNEIDHMLGRFQERVFAAWRLEAYKSSFGTEHYRLQTAHAQRQAALESEQMQQLAEMGTELKRLESGLRDAELGHEATREELGNLRLQLEREAQLKLGRGATAADARSKSHQLALQAAIMALWHRIAVRGVRERLTHEQQLQLEQVQSEADEQRTQLEEELRDVNHELRRRESDWRLRMQELESDHDDKIKALRREQEDQSRQWLQKHEAELDELRCLLQREAAEQLQQQEEEFTRRLESELGELDAEWKLKLQGAEQDFEARLRAELDATEQEWSRLLREKEGEANSKLSSAKDVWDLQLAKVHEEHEAHRRKSEIEANDAKDIFALQLEKVHQEHLARAKDQEEARRLLEEHFERQRLEDKQKLQMATMEALCGKNVKALASLAFAAWHKYLEYARQESVWLEKEKAWEQRHLELEGSHSLHKQQVKAARQAQIESTFSALSRQGDSASIAAFFSAWHRLCEVGRLDRKHQSLEEQHQADRLRWDRELRDTRARSRARAREQADKLYGGGLSPADRHQLSQVMAAWLLVSMALRWARSRELAAGEVERLEALLLEERGGRASEVERLEALLLEERSSRASEVERLEALLLEERGGRASEVERLEASTADALGDAKDLRLLAEKLQEQASNHRFSLGKSKAANLEQALLRQVLGDWRQGLLHRRFDALANTSQEAVSRLRERQRMLIFKTSTSLLTAGSKQMVNCLFSAWKARCEETKALMRKERELEAKLNSVGGQFLKKAASVLLHRVLTAWRLHSRGSAEEKRVLAERSKLKAGTRAAAASLAEKMLLLRKAPPPLATFFAWHRVAAGKSGEALQGKVDSLKAAGRSRRDYLLLRWSQQSRARLAHWALRHWLQEAARCQLEKSKGRWSLELRRSKDRGAMCGTRLAAKFWVLKTRLLLFATFASWRLRLAEDKHHLQLEQLEAQEQDCHASLASSLLLSNAFKRWRHWSHARAMDRLRGDGKGRKVSGPGRVLAVVSSIEEKRSRLLCVELFLRWSYDARLQRPGKTSPVSAGRAGPVLLRSCSYAPRPATTAVTLDSLPLRSTCLTTQAVQAVATSCPHCGNTYLADSVFCRFCGTKRGGEMHYSPRTSIASPRAFSVTMPALVSPHQSLAAVDQANFAVALPPRSPTARSVSPHGQAHFASATSPRAAIEVDVERKSPPAAGQESSEIFLRAEPVASNLRVRPQCPRCGNMYMPDSVFCRQCGHRRNPDASLASPRSAHIVLTAPE
eukprot:TRINITY_DN28307_c0_g1_i1.p1 TRINITY_DN28307_c0_g1~~TRINITY_DN28307_c0_g1_i1.p1  ORF type:complete len:1450 (+),score=382.88 TRINITY_DN28307_c0_g1_i1:68-4417(+)